MVLLAGCDAPSRSNSKRGPAVQLNAQNSLFDSVADNLEHLEQFETTQILSQVCDRLNQWCVQEKPQIQWQPDPLLGGLSDEIRNLRVLKVLDGLQFRPTDAWFLQENVWLRNISKHARADQFDDVAVAERLFDWTVRNIQLDPDGDLETKHLNWHGPIETLLLGRGPAADRAWIFMLLCRQQGLDAVFLGLPAEDGRPAQAWLPALWSDGKLYLFDCRLGLPIPGPEGRNVATLAEVAADDALLRRLDLDEAHPYPVRADDLKHVIANVEGSPADLSKRMALVESRLTGKHKMSLTSAGNALAERLKQNPQVGVVRLWPRPFEISLRHTKIGPADVQEIEREMAVLQSVPDLMRGRSLYLKGEYDGETGAKQYYLRSRVSDEALENFKLPEAEARQYGSPEALAAEEAHRIVVLRHAKQNASYWLGLLLFEQQDYASASDYFMKRTLKANPDGRWTAGATYAMGRIHEAQGHIDEAVAAYESDQTSPQSHGNRLRARWLKEKSAGGKVADK